MAAIPMTPTPPIEVADASLRSANDSPLDHLEAEMARAEEDYVRTARHLQEQAAALSQRLEALQQQATNAGATLVQQRCASLTLPTLNVDAPAQQARDARLAAMRARQTASDMVTNSFAVFEEAAMMLEVQLAAAEAEFVRCSTPEAAQPIPPPPPVAPPPEVPTTQMPAVVDNRRSAPRIDLQTAVAFEGENNFYTGFSSDISEGGLFVATINILNPGTEIDLTFKLPNGYRAQEKCVVRWVREYNEVTPDVVPGMGLQFTEINAATKEQLLAFLGERDPLFYDDD